MNLFGSTLRISKCGIIHDKRVICDVCGTLCSYNGSSNKGRHGLSRSARSFFQKGQQYCPTCNRTVQIENEWIDNMIESIDQFLISQIISLSEDMSEERIVEHLDKTMSIETSKTNHTPYSNKEGDFVKGF